MKYLAINTCDSLEILLNADKKYYFRAEDKTLASVSLLPRIDSMLNEANLSLKDLDFLACVVGAGSFTGLRIGVTTVKSLCFALDKPALGVTFFDYMAYNNSLPLTTVIDGSGGVCYLKNFTDEEENQPVCIRNHDILKHSTGNILASASFAEELKDAKIFVPSADLLAGTIETVLKQKGLCSYKNLAPLYLRRSQPEREAGEI